jgi:hypothetical protein
MRSEPPESTQLYSFYVCPRRQVYDPIELRKEIKAKARQADARALTFKECAEALMNAHEPSWKNPKHRQQWRNTLKTYAYPKLGNFAVSAVTAELVLEVAIAIGGTDDVSAATEYRSP